ncbi:MAG: hypothetical protein H6739_24885 [Alphaproteobacteria bacterium]|nr:hypothetical protein [Alphaproteobacteria bacterium]
MVDEQLVEHDPAGEDVAAPIDGLALGLLRAHVGELAAAGAVVVVVVIADQAGDAEVHELHLALEGQDHVVGGHVAVDDVEGLAPRAGAGVRIGQAPGDAGGDVDRHLRRQALAPRAQAAHGAGEIPPVDVLHRDVVVVPLAPEGEDLDHVGVGQHRRDLGLSDEHGDEVGGAG